ncbi:conserved hypothetical protein [Gloeothece citriformis PCC 7424]|uniref:DUF2993 domain-containing protein n=1 Tax=Gloeothece citriformis (strain PCC 7424) TaxID=65393 RepID=B7KEV5_GLOC7|nr:DUF2993 domain-containing protein [Gloeothece citriformis]ACK69130.1 conserved hypothetical protein [Gloeothece citriformis PCC 7424]
MTSIVFGSLPLPNQSGDQIVSKAVSTAIAALFKRTGNIQANVRAEPVTKLLQGSVDGFDFIGNAMLMYNGLRIEAMELYVQAVSIDFSAIFKGQVKLRQPTQATMRVVLTENDLTTSFNTPFVIEKLQKLQFQGKPLYFQNTEMILDEDKSLRLKSQIRVGDEPEPVNVDMKAFLEVIERRKIQFIDVTYGGDAQGQELGKALIDHVNHLLDLDQFALDGTQLRVDRIRMKDKQLVFYGIAKINQFPQRKPKAAA